MRRRWLPWLLWMPGAALAAAGTTFIVDGDGDGIDDTRDLCLYTPAGATVDGFGCSGNDDEDGDQVADLLDHCPMSPPGARVDRLGCAIDSDFDGVADGLDRCDGTALGQPVDARGCARMARLTAPPPPPAVAPRVVAAVPAAAAQPLPRTPARSVAAPRAVLAGMPAMAVDPAPTAAEPVAQIAVAAAPGRLDRPSPVASVASAQVPPRAVPVPPPPLRARPTTLSARSRLAAVGFEPGDAPLAEALASALTPLRDRLGAGAEHYVELVGLTTGARGDSSRMAQRVKQVQRFIEAQGIPGARIVYALRPARAHEHAGQVELHQR